jgi:putative ABC transport system permease protein
VTVLASTSEGARLDVDVVGVFQTFSKEFDARAVWHPTARGERVACTTGVNSLVVVLNATEDTDAVAYSLEGCSEPAFGEDQVELNDYEKAVALYQTHPAC